MLLAELESLRVCFKFVPGFLQLLQVGLALFLQRAFREKQQKKGLDNVVKRTQNQVTRTAKWTRELKGEHGEELAPEEEEYIEVAAPESPLPQQ